MQKMVIELSSDSNDCDDYKVRAVLPGNLEVELYDSANNLSRIILTAADALYLNFLVGSLYPSEDQCITYPPQLPRWYSSWINNSVIQGPSKIIYENVETTNISMCGPIHAGEIIGNAGQDPEDPEDPEGKRQLKLCIQYNTDNDIDHKFMHPREFFSLLFWQEKYDELYTPSIQWDATCMDFSNDPDSPYRHPLVQRMMRSKEDGTSITNGRTYENDDWLGLRPPLRTYKRVEWEAKRELTNNGEKWAGDKALIKDGKCLLQNPFIYRGIVNANNCNESDANRLPYCGYAKCNIFAGEIAFRSGFKVFVMKRPAADFLGYMTENLGRNGTNGSSVSVGLPDGQVNLKSTVVERRMIQTTEKL